VVVFQHDHTAQVVAVRVNATNEHAVLLDKAETGSRLASAGDDALPAVRAGFGQDATRPVGGCEGQLR
jgi:hypothetical protein